MVPGWRFRKRIPKLWLPGIGKINNYVQNYGKTNGYTVVLGTTNNGSVMYGNDNIDLTNTILKELNELYVKDSLSIPNHK